MKFVTLTRPLFSFSTPAAIFGDLSFADILAAKHFRWKRLSLEIVYLAVLGAAVKVLCEAVMSARVRLCAELAEAMTVSKTLGLVGQCLDSVIQVHEQSRFEPAGMIALSRVVCGVGLAEQVVLWVDCGLFG